MLRTFLLVIVVSILAIGFACRTADSPTEAYKRVFAAVKSKDIEAIKKQLSKKTIEFGMMAAAKNSTPIEKMYENGFTGTTFSDTLPPMRDERIKENMGAVEVWNSKDTQWEDVPFVNEDGAWKIAFGDLFAGSFKSPGPGRERREREAANAVANNYVPPAPNTNTNTSKPKVIKVPNVPEPNKSVK